MSAAHNEARLITVCIVALVVGLFVGGWYASRSRQCFTWDLRGNPIVYCHKGEHLGGDQ